jgi:hypothetical protein
MEKNGMEAAKELFENEKEWIGRTVTAVQIAHILMGFINLHLSPPTPNTSQHPHLYLER